MSIWMRRSGIQLAYPFEEKRLAKWNPPFIMQPKLDGDRCRAVHDEHGFVTLYSSEEKELWAVPEIKKELESVGIRDLELDGENYIHGRPQAEIHGIVSSQRIEFHEDHEQVTFVLFDLINEEWDQKTRLKMLSTLYREKLSHLPHIKLVPFYIVYTLEEVYHMLQVFLSQGYEGFILRELGAKYVRRRSIYMMKFKPKKKDVFLMVFLEVEWPLKY